MTETDRAAPHPPRRLLVLDTSYTLEIIRQRGLENSVTCRDLEGFFEHVWSVHPFASLLTSPAWTPRHGRAVWHALSPRHTFVEGKIGRFAGLSRFGFLNFFLSQAGLFVILARLIRRERISVLRVGDPLYLGLFGWALARLTGVPLVIRLNANNDKIRENTGAPIFPRLFRSTAVEKKVERFVLPRADLVAGPNDDNVAFALANGARPDRVTVFRYGNVIAKEHVLPPEARPPRPEILSALGVEPGKYLMCIGRLEPVKFPDDAVRVLSRVPAERGMKLVFAGEGGMRAELQALADELGVGDRLVFAGNQNQTQLSALIPDAAAVVSPLTGRSLTEAAFGAAPIVAYDLDWQGELIETGVTGELAPFREWERLAEGVLHYLDDPDYAMRMGRGVRDRALEMLDPERLDAHEREQYSRLLARRGGA